MRSNQHTTKSTNTKPTQTRAPSSLRGPLPPVPSSLKGAPFSVDTPWLSLLTLRYVVAQVYI